MITNEFKKKYPRQFKYLVQYYGGRKNIFDMQAAINMYLRGDTIPKCELCDKILTITKKFRELQSKLRCSNHINTLNILSKELVLQSETDNCKIVKFPDKILTRSATIEVECAKHGSYTVAIGHFMNKMRCKKCHYESLVGITREPTSELVKQKLSIAKLGKKMNLSAEVKEKKSLNQQLAWERRKNNVDAFDKYIEGLSFRRKQYIEKHGMNNTNKSKTNLEIRFEQFLIDNDIEYITQYIVNAKRFDFYLPKMKLLVEVDGEFWHRFPSSIKNDIEKHRVCVANNIQLVRISSENYCPNIIFENANVQNIHTTQILLKRGINEF